MPQDRDTPHNVQSLPEMRGLTVRQPWAWAIVFGGKLVENRTWTTGYRGPLAIHAAVPASRRGLRSPLVARALRTWHRRGGEEDPFRHRGAIIGIAELQDCHYAEPGCCDSPWAEYEVYSEDERRPGRVTHWVLVNPRPVEPPIPVRGRLQVWRMGGELQAQVWRQRTFAKADHEQWYRETGHCGGCGGPGNYCSCSASVPCGCRGLHEMGSAGPEGLEAIMGLGPVTVGEQASLFG